MESMGYEFCMSDTDLWLKPETRPEDGVQYYSYLLCYVGTCCYSAFTLAFPLKPGLGTCNVCLWYSEKDKAHLMANVSGRFRLPKR